MKLERLPNLDSIPAKINVGAKIKKCREECGLSQLELSKEIGKDSATFISLIESQKRNINIELLNRIAHTLNVDIIKLIK